MPELPEVETVMQGLKTVIEGKQLTNVRFFREDLRWPIPVREFIELVQGKKALGLTRRSKFIVLQMEKGYVFFHLGMTGNFFFEDVASPVRPHTHLVLGFKGSDDESNLGYLHFVDPRRFGSISVGYGEQWWKDKRLAHLGVEPLEKKDLGRHLLDLARNKKGPVKNFIMNQETLVGVGNIYACESLFRAGIDPKREARSLSLADFRSLSRHIRAVLKEAIKAGGSTISDFQKPGGKPGYFSHQFRVYGREDEPCLVCSNPIVRIRQAGRSTWFCQTCQS